MTARKRFETIEWAGEACRAFVGLDFQERRTHGAASVARAVKGIGILGAAVRIDVHRPRQAHLPEWARALHNTVKAQAP